MKRFRYAPTATAWVAAITLAWAGCGEPADSTPSSEGADQQAQNRQAHGPAQVVFDFLEAVRQGNDMAAAERLTKLAQKKTAELDMVVAPPGSDTAHFEVAGTEMVGEFAHVGSTWTDIDFNEQPRTDQITWILREEAGNWRISGMSTAIIPGEAPVVLNFEDPADMLEKQKAAEEAALRRAQSQVKQAENPFDASRR